MNIYFESVPQMKANEIDIRIRGQAYDEEIKALERYLTSFLVNSTRLLTDSQGRLHRISVEAILYIDVLGDYSTIHLLEEAYTFRSSLIEMKQLFATEQLIQVSRNTLVNKQMIVRIENSFSGNMTAYLKQNQQVSISRK